MVADDITIFYTLGALDNLPTSHCVLIVVLQSLSQHEKLLTRHEYVKLSSTGSGHYLSSVGVVVLAFAGQRGCGDSMIVSSGGCSER